jgi:hypothetical protein
LIGKPAATLSVAPALARPESAPAHANPH